MNIKFGMDNFYTKYLKRFLNSQLSESTAILGDFDKTDLSLLIKYLNLPNVKNMFEVNKEIIVKFPELNTLFNTYLSDNKITWTGKVISKECSEFIINNLDNIQQYCESVGWEMGNITEWIDTSKDINNDGKIDNEDRNILNNIIYNGIEYPEDIMKRADLNLDGLVNQEDLDLLDSYMLNNRLQINIAQTNRLNYFPNEDMMVFVNQFDGTFLYNYAIRNGLDTDDKPHYDDTHLYKIALYKCTPGQKITIAHNSPNLVHLIMGCSYANLKQNITNEILQNVVEIDLNPGEGYQYTCTSVNDGTGYDANWVCIQCPSNYNDLSGTEETTLILEKGDLNFDAKIDMEDYVLLANYTATGPGSEFLHWDATPKQLAVMDLNDDGKIDVKDAIVLYNFLQGDPTYPDLGLTHYTYNTVIDKDSESDNVENFLIINGHYDNTVNIPFRDFVNDDWVIHEKFFNYLLDMSIHEYSDSENISYLQKLLKEAYPEHSYDPSFFYPGNYSENMKNIMKDYQRSKTHYVQGDLNRDNKLDKVDLQLLREYLDDENVKKYNTILQYLNGEITLTPEQIKELDSDNNGVIDTTDRDYYNNIIAETYSGTFRYRADCNQDGNINELDYTLLEQNVNGENDLLKIYDITFMLGWCDVQTEALLEQDYNISGNISEVSK